MYLLQNQPLLWNETFFSWSPNYKEFKKCCNIIHDFTDALIQQRRDVLQDEDSMHGKKNCLAFLDLLLKASNDDQLSIKEIRDEVVRI